MADPSERWWTVQHGPGAVLATAIHDGNELRPEVANAMALPDDDRLREEDPFTGQAVVDVPTHIIAHRSRFEFDLNRPPESAVYRTPEQSWGLHVWKQEPDEAFVARSLAIHADYYRMLGHILDSIALRHDRFVLIDVHSYNHRRDGPDAEPTAIDKAPDINIGTFSMPREHWAPLIDPLTEAMRGFDFNGRDIRSNIHAGAKREAVEIGETELRVAELIRPKLIADGMFLVGIDIVGEKVLEANVFSPGNLESCSELAGVDFTAPILDSIERKVAIVAKYGGTFDNRHLAVL